MELHELARLEPVLSQGAREGHTARMHVARLEDVLHRAPAMSPQQLRQEARRDGGGGARAGGSLLLVGGSARELTPIETKRNRRIVRQGSVHNAADSEAHHAAVTGVDETKLAKLVA
jgi:hypothetical protein